MICKTLPSTLRSLWEFDSQQLYDIQGDRLCDLPLKPLTETCKS